MKKDRTKDRSFKLILVIISMLIVFGFGFFKLFNINQKLRAEIPYLVPGENIDYFDILGQDAQTRDRSVLDNNRPSLIFIFSRPCSPCNANIKYWKKITGILKEKADVYGIVLGEINETFELTEKAKINFNVYVPEDLKRFTENMRVKLNFPQTIIYHNGKVVSLKLGTLEGEDAGKIIKTVKALI